MKQYLMPMAALALCLSLGVAALAQTPTIQTPPAPVPAVLEVPAQVPVVPVQVQVPAVQVKQAASNLHVVANSGNGVGNTMVISNNGQVGRTLVTNVRNGFGNHLVIVNGKQVNHTQQEFTTLMQPTMTVLPAVPVFPLPRVAPVRADAIDIMVEQAILDALGQKR